MNQPTKNWRSVPFKTERDKEGAGTCKRAGRLSEAEQRYHSLLKISSEAILIHSGGRLVLTNDATVKLFKATSAEQLVGTPILDLIQIDTCQASIPSLGMSSSSPLNVECKLIRMDHSSLNATLVEIPCRYKKQPAMQLIVRVAPTSDETDHQEMESRLNNMAQYDLTTELPNWNQFYDRLKGAIARASRNQQLLGVILLALDHFKLVNTTLGYQAGDNVLKLTAERLKKSIREGDTVARVGGDEFAIILEGITESQQIGTIAQRILKIICQPLLADSQEIRVTGSIGISVYPFNTDDIDKLLQKADVAMCYAKEYARNSCQFYSPDLDSRSARDQSHRAETKVRLAGLTPREREVLEFLIAGKTNKMIAYLLGTSSRTIENHRAKIMDKMQADSLPQLVQMVLELRGR